MKTQVLMTANQPYLGLASIAMHLWKNVIGIQPTLYHVLHPGQVEYISLNGNVIGTPVLPEYHISQQCWMHRLYQTSCQSDDDLVMIGDADIWPLRPQFFDDLQEEARKHSDQIVATAYGMGPKDKGRLRACHLIGHGRTWKRLIGNLTFDDVFNKALSLSQQQQRFAVDELWLTNKLKDDHVSFLLKDWSDKNEQVSWVELDKQQWWPDNCPVYVHMPKPSAAFYRTETFQDLLTYIRGLK